MNPPPAPGPFDERVVIVTGAARGLGQAHARLLASLGATLVVNDAGVAGDGSSPDDEPIRALAAELETGGATVIASPADLSDREACQALVRESIAAFGRIDAIVHSAGIVDRTTLAEIDPSGLRRTLAINLEAAVWLCQAGIEVMRLRRYGRIVLTVSGHGLLVTDPPALPVYALGKAAQYGLMSALATEAAADGILINAISPVAATRMYTGPDPERFAPELISPGVAFLASDRCREHGLVLRAAAGSFALGGYAVTDGAAFDGRPTFDDFADRWPDIVAGPWHRIDEPD